GARPVERVVALILAAATPLHAPVGEVERLLPLVVEGEGVFGSADRVGVEEVGGGHVTPNELVLGQEQVQATRYPPCPSRRLVVDMRCRLSSARLLRQDIRAVEDAQPEVVGEEVAGVDRARGS